MVLKTQINYAWDEDIEVEMYRKQDGIKVEESSGELSGSTGDKSGATVSLGSEMIMPRRIQRIRKAMGIAAHASTAKSSPSGLSATVEGGKWHH